MPHRYDMVSSQFVSNLQHDRVPYERYDYFHVFAEVKAEMKKATKYEVKIKMNQSCKVLNTWCQCPEGSEHAICKHTCAVINGLTDFSRKKLFRSPTGKLQAWHRPTSVNMEPVKAKELFQLTQLAKDVETEVILDALSDLNPNLPILSVGSKDGIPLYVVYVQSKNSLPSFDQSDVKTFVFPFVNPNHKTFFIIFKLNKNYPRLKKYKKKSEEVFGLSKDLTSENKDFYEQNVVYIDSPPLSIDCSEEIIQLSKDMNPENTDCCYHP